MRISRLFNPAHAVRDFVAFAKARERHELWFLAAAVFITTMILWGFVHDSHFERPYKRDIQYVQDWRLDRTDEEIVAQQKIDSAENARILAEAEKRRAARQAEFKKIDDQLNAWGI